MKRFLRLWPLWLWVCVVLGFARLAHGEGPYRVKTSSTTYGDAWYTVERDGEQIALFVTDSKPMAENMAFVLNEARERRTNKYRFHF